MGVYERCSPQTTWRNDKAEIEDAITRASVVPRFSVADERFIRVNIPGARSASVGSIRHVVSSTGRNEQGPWLLFTFLDVDNASCSELYYQLPPHPFRPSDLSCSSVPPMRPLSSSTMPAARTQIWSET